jgi:hypothetical protein
MPAGHLPAGWALCAGQGAAPGWKFKEKQLLPSVKWSFSAID